MYQDVLIIAGCIIFIVILKVFSRKKGGFSLESDVYRTHEQISAYMNEVKNKKNEMTSDQYTAYVRGQLAEISSLILTREMKGLQRVESLHTVQKFLEDLEENS